MCVCSVVAAALLLLAICLLREGCICWKAHHRKTVELQGNGAIEMNNVRSACRSISRWQLGSLQDNCVQLVTPVSVCVLAGGDHRQ